MSKVAVVTGANSGLGLDSVRQLAKSEQFGTVYMWVRSQAKGDAAVAALEKKGCAVRKLKVMVADVSSVAGARQATDKLLEVLGNTKVDFLLGNAGQASPGAVKRTDEGLELTFAASMAGHAVMTMKLISAGAMAPGAAVVFAGSEAATGSAPGMTVVDISALRKKMGPEATAEDAIKAVAKAAAPYKFSGFNQYATVKAISAWYIAQLAVELKSKGSDVKVFSISPGSVPGTSIANKFPRGLRIMMTLMKPMMYAIGMGQSMAKGAGRYLSAMDMPASDSGIMFASKKGKMIGPLANNTRTCPHLADRELQVAAFAAVNDLVGESFQ